LTIGSGGVANILIAFAAGLILTGFYLWRRDLVTNMIGYGLVDFVANVLPKSFSSLARFRNCRRSPVIAPA